MIPKYIRTTCCNYAHCGIDDCTNARHISYGRVQTVTDYISEGDNIYVIWTATFFHGEEDDFARWPDPLYTKISEKEYLCQSVLDE